MKHSYIANDKEAALLHSGQQTAIIVPMKQQPVDCSHIHKMADEICEWRNRRVCFFCFFASCYLCWCWLCNRSRKTKIKPRRGGRLLNMPKGLHAFAAINDADAKNGTRHLEMGVDVTRVDYRNSGTVVSIGIGGNHVFDIQNGKKIPFLFLVDAEELKRVQELP